MTVGTQSNSEPPDPSTNVKKADRQDHWAKMVNCDHAESVVERESNQSRSEES